MTASTAADPIGREDTSTSEGLPPMKATRGRLPFSVVLLGLILGVAVSIAIAVAVGTADIAPGDEWRIALHRLFGLGEPNWSGAQERIVWEIRLPRALLATLVGASLAVSGVALQAMVRNPMADPTILGGTSGAGVGAVIVLVLGVRVGGQYALSLAAFIGCLVGFGLAFLLARSGRRLSPIRLVLAGIAVSYLLSAVTNMVIFMSGNENALNSVMFWMLGGLGRATWDNLGLPAVALLVAGSILVGMARPINALLFGDETAASLGTPPDALRRRMLVVVAALTGVSVAIAGGVGFVGLVVPHAARMLTGADNRRVLPLAALLGALFLLWADMAARTLVAPGELPIGVITALVGAPVFAILLRSSVGRKEAG